MTYWSVQSPLEKPRRLPDANCATNPAKIGPDADGQAGECDNILLVIGAHLRQSSWNVDVPAHEARFGAIVAAIRLADNASEP